MQVHTQPKAWAGTETHESYSHVCWWAQQSAWCTGKGHDSQVSPNTRMPKACAPGATIELPRELVAPLHYSSCDTVTHQSATTTLVSACKPQMGGITPHAHDPIPTKRVSRGASLEAHSAGHKSNALPHTTTGTWPGNRVTTIQQSSQTDNMGGEGRVNSSKQAYGRSPCIHLV
jgi:hypothetical protein